MVISNDDSYDGVSRATTVMADGKNTNQQPNWVPGVSLTPAGGKRIGEWINPAAFSVAAPDTWGDAGTEIGRGPGLLQIDLAISRKTGHLDDPE